MKARGLFNLLQGDLHPSQLFLGLFQFDAQSRPILYKPHPPIDNNCQPESGHQKRRMAQQLQHNHLLSRKACWHISISEIRRRVRPCQTRPPALFQRFSSVQAPARSPALARRTKVDWQAAVTPTL